MARIRTIKPEFPHSESMGRVSRDARLAFIMFWTIADDSGRLRANSRMLASILFPYDDDAASLMESWLAELEREDCIVRYSVEGTTYMQIINWKDHQRVDKPQPSKIPEFQEDSRVVANIREQSCRDQDQGPGPGMDQGPRTKDQGMDQGPGPGSRGKSAAPPKADTRPTWTAYAEAYRQRYRSDPLRNASTNSKMRQFVQAVGAGEAPAIAAFYVRHNGRYYVQQMHPVGVMLKDAEKLRTEWATSTQMTEGRARQLDRKQTTANAFAPLIAEAEERERREREQRPAEGHHGNGRTAGDGHQPGGGDDAEPRSGELLRAPGAGSPEKVPS